MCARHVYPFEKLRVWQDARHLVKDVYAVTRKLPRSEMYVDLGFLAVSDESSLREKIEEVSRQLNVLRIAQLAS